MKTSITTRMAGDVKVVELKGKITIGAGDLQMREAIHQALQDAAKAGQITYAYQDNIGYSGDMERVLREVADQNKPKIIFGDAFGNEEAARAVAADYPDIAFVFGSGGGPADPNFSVFDNWIHEPAYLAGMLAGGMTKTNTLGVVAGYPVIDFKARLVDGSFQTARKPVIGQTVSNGTYALNVGAEGSDVVVLPWNAGRSRRERLELGVSSTIPWVITLNGGATKTQIDLTDVLLRELVLDASASSVRVIVGPQVTDGARVTINGSVGSYHVTLPKDLHILLTLDTSLVSRNLEGFTSTGGNRYVHDGPGKAVDVSIKTSVGAIQVDLR